MLASDTKCFCIAVKEQLGQALQADQFRGQGSSAYRSRAAGRPTGARRRCWPRAGLPASAAPAAPLQDHRCVQPCAGGWRWCTRSCGPRLAAGHLRTAALCEEKAGKGAHRCGPVQCEKPVGFACQWDSAHAVSRERRLPAPSRKLRSFHSPDRPSKPSLALGGAFAIRSAMQCFTAAQPASVTSRAMSCQGEGESRGVGKEGEQALSCHTPCTCQAAFSRPDCTCSPKAPSHFLSTHYVVGAAEALGSTGGQHQ